MRIDENRTERQRTETFDITSRILLGSELKARKDGTGRVRMPLSAL